MGEVVQPAGARRRRRWGRKVEGRREAGMVDGGGGSEWWRRGRGREGLGRETAHGVYLVLDISPFVAPGHG